MWLKPFWLLRMRFNARGWSYLGWAASGKRVDGNVFQQFYGGLTNDNTDFSLANICWEKKRLNISWDIYIYIYIYISIRYLVGTSGTQRLWCQSPSTACWSLGICHGCISFGESCQPNLPCLGRAAQSLHPQFNQCFFGDHFWVLGAFTT